MANILTFNQVVDILTDIARRHYLINTFFLGKDNEFAESNDIVYPLLAAYPDFARMPQSNGEYKTINIDLRCKIIDQTFTGEENKRHVHSDTLRIAQDIVNELNQHPYFQRSNVTLVGDINMTPLEEFEDDFTAGWSFIISLRLINNNSYCGLPFEEIIGYSAAGPTSTGYSTSVQYLTCNTVTACTSLQSYVLSVAQSVSGGTGTGGNYLPLSGGTVSGNTNFTAEILSGGTNLYNIFALSGATGGASTYVQSGLNTYTGGTASAPSVNISAATLSYLSASTISGNTVWAYNDPWTIELINSTVVDFYAPYNMAINSVTNILNSPTITLKDDGSDYSLGATIALGSKITVSASTYSVVILNGVRL